MSDFLDSLLARHTAAADVVRPRPLSVYEPLPGPSLRSPASGVFETAAAGEPEAAEDVAPSRSAAGPVEPAAGPMTGTQGSARRAVSPAAAPDAGSAAAVLRAAPRTQPPRLDSLRQAVQGAAPVLPPRRSSRSVLAAAEPAPSTAVEGGRGHAQNPSHAATSAHDAREPRRRIAHRAGEDGVLPTASHAQTNPAKAEAAVAIRPDGMQPAGVSAYTARMPKPARARAPETGNRVTAPPSFRPQPAAAPDLESHFAAARSALQHAAVHGEPPPAIHVTIGRIEVRAATAAAQPPGKQAAREPATSLEEYMRQRKGGLR